VQVKEVPIEETSADENQISVLSNENKIFEDLKQPELTDFEISDVQFNQVTNQQQSHPQQIQFDISGLLESDESKTLLENSNADATLITNDDTMVTLVNGVTCAASPPAPVNTSKVVKVQTNLQLDLNEKCENDSDNSKDDSSVAIQAIRNDQMSLEDRIAELNRQHNEAKCRLHNLRRQNVKVLEEMQTN